MGFQGYPLTSPLSPGLFPDVTGDCPELSSYPLEKRTGTRRSNFEEFEEQYLRPLPDIPFDIDAWQRGRAVQPNPYVVVKKNRAYVTVQDTKDVVDYHAYPHVD